jgi:hypothetical protein
VFDLELPRRRLWWMPKQYSGGSQYSTSEDGRLGLGTASGEQVIIDGRRYMEWLWTEFASTVSSSTPDLEMYDHLESERNVWNGKFP